MKFLPDGFEALEPLVKEWAIPGENDRIRKRLRSTMPEITQFYDQMMQRIDDVVKLLEQYPADKLPADVERLLWLTLSLADVASAVELFGAPIEEDVFDAIDPLRLVPQHTDFRGIMKV